MRIAILSLMCAVASASAEPRPELDERFTGVIARAAAGYAKWSRVDSIPNLAPVLCRAPLPGDYGAPSRVRASAAEGSAHDQKLYYLWASDKRAYLSPDAAMPVGFAIVKQSFAAVPSDPPRPPADPSTSALPMGERPPIATMTTADGHHYRTGAPKDLFIIAKVGDHDRAGADAGWVYGTVSPDGRVTSAGRVATCMGCHEGAPHERLFGLAPAPAR